MNCNEIPIALYAKGWYGDFTGDNNPYNELRMIISAICWIDKEFISDADIFDIVSNIFFIHVNKSGNPSSNFCEVFRKSLFLDYDFYKPKFTDPKISIINRMLLMLAQSECKNFEDPSMPLNADVLKVLPMDDEKRLRWENMHGVGTLPATVTEYQKALTSE